MKERVTNHWPTVAAMREGRQWDRTNIAVWAFGLGLMTLWVLALGFSLFFVITNLVRCLNG
jgi:hypothetical protein